mgnify:CR=1 FL=1|tara:strand:+ start:89383 stop:90309 length:927 start_codon:yes stop_codon:yes gene_type:complete
MSKIYVIIVTYNGIQWLHKTLDSIPNNCELIVVDNCSSDSTVDFIKKNHPKIKLFIQSKNLGFGGGNNIGIKYALKNNANFVFLLNQDAYLYNDTIDNLIDVSKKNPEFAIISPIHLDSRALNLDWNFSTYLKAEDADSLKKTLRYPDKNFNQVYNTNFVNAAAWLLPKKTLETIGGFDPIFFHYGEDNNYCQRVTYHKLKIAVVSNAYVIHDREYKRLNKNISLEDALKKREKKLKIVWADINNDFSEKVEIRKKILKKKLLKAFLKIEVRKFKEYKAELKLIDNIVPEIINSRNVNITKGSHYLNE